MRIRNVTKKFGDIAAVADVSLDIYKGELFCLLGGSGSGKSTLLRMLAGFEVPTSGRIEIDGQDMSDVPPYNRPVNMMFQSYALFPHMSVAQNIAYGLKRDGLPKAEIDARVAELLQLVKLTGYENRKPNQLSGGQRQRVALARALAKRPKLLLLDEPLGALDKKLREETQFELVKIQETLGVTFIVVTHDQEEAMSLATRIGVMNQGEIAMVGEPTEIYEFPNSRFVANFIGSANMVEGVVTEDEPDHVRIRSKELGTDIYVESRCRLRARPDPVVGDPARKDRPDAREAGAAAGHSGRRQHRQGLCRGHRLSGRHDRLSGPARQRPLHARHQDQCAARRPRCDLVGRDGVGELGRLVRLGAGVMTSFDADPPRRPWTSCGAALAAVGLSGRGAGDRRAGAVDDGCSSSCRWRWCSASRSPSSSSASRPIPICSPPRAGRYS